MIIIIEIYKIKPSLMKSLHSVLFHPPNFQFSKNYNLKCYSAPFKLK